MWPFKRARRGAADTETAPASLGPPAHGICDEDLVAEAERAVLPGFLTRDEAIQRIVEVFELTERDPRAIRAVDGVWSVRETDERTWSGQSDYERLESAFHDLEAQGIVGRMNFADCNTCATDEIDSERTPIDVEDGYAFREWAYTFFHEQDADRLVEQPTTLFLTYSAWRPADDIDPALLVAARAGDQDARSKVIEDTDSRVGELVTKALRARDFDVAWSGDPNTRLAVRIRDWRKPLPT